MQIRIKYYLIAVTLFAVLCDTMLLPFYPHFFSKVFGVDSSIYVGIYLAAMTAVVMLVFPFWAWLAKKTGTLNLLIVTQMAAGACSILTHISDIEWNFWIFSLMMVMFKASYLLVYPYIMSLESKENHTQTVGVLSVVVHFSAIGGAVVGGWFIQFIDPKYVFLIMSLGDFSQTIVCLYIRRMQNLTVNSKNTSLSENQIQQKSNQLLTEPLKQQEEKLPEDLQIRSTENNDYFMIKLAFIMLVFYFSAQLARPFFTTYWESISQTNSSFFSAFIYAIPAWIALFALWMNRQLSHSHFLLQIIPVLILGSLGFFLQASDQVSIVIIGRCLYGWSLFQVTVKLDVLMYQKSIPDEYAKDFSRIYLFQSMGNLLASFLSGVVVSLWGLSSFLWLAGVGFLLTLFLLYIWMPTVHRFDSVKSK